MFVKKSYIKKKSYTSAIWGYNISQGSLKIVLVTLKQTMWKKLDGKEKNFRHVYGVFDTDKECTFLL